MCYMCAPQSDFAVTLATYLNYEFGPKSNKTEVLVITHKDKITLKWITEKSHSIKREPHISQKRQQGSIKIKWFNEIKWNYTETDAHNFVTSQKKQNTDLKDTEKKSFGRGVITYSRCGVNDIFYKHKHQLMHCLYIEIGTCIFFWL